MENKVRLISLCREHDKIKNSDIRLAGLEDQDLPLNSKDIYYYQLREFIEHLINYMEDYKNKDYVEQTLKWCKKRKKLPKTLSEELELSYMQSTNLLHFIAGTEFLVLSVVHEIIEYMYYLLIGEYWTEGFGNR